MNTDNDVRRPLTEEHRRRVARRYVGSYFVIGLAALVAICTAWVVNIEGPVDVPIVVIIGPLLYLWGMSSLVVLTFGWIGVFMSPSTVWVVIGGASVVAVMSGFIFFAVSLFTTPVLFVAGAIVRAIIVMIQRWMGIRLVAGATPTTSPATAS